MDGPAEESKGSFKYDLFGVSNHMGGLGGGHYTAYCKNVNVGFVLLYESV